MGFIEVSVITFVGILIFCIISTIISQRKFRRELKSQMEDINRRQMERMRVDRENLIIGRGYTRTVNLDESQINAIIENAEAIVESRNFKPYKHIKRHSIR